MNQGKQDKDKHQGSARGSARGVTIQSQEEAAMLADGHFLMINTHGPGQERSRRISSIRKPQVRDKDMAHEDAIDRMGLAHSITFSEIQEESELCEESRQGTRVVPLLKVDNDDEADGRGHEDDEEESWSEDEDEEDENDQAILKNRNLVSSVVDFNRPVSIQVTFRGSLIPVSRKDQLVSSHPSIKVKKDRNNNVADNLLFDAADPTKNEPARQTSMS